MHKTAVALVLTWLVFNPALSQEAVSISPTFGFQWPSVDWSTTVRGMATEGAAGLANGKVISIVIEDKLDIIQRHITSDYVILFFSPSDLVSLEPIQH
jgi:hypothetical protein